MWVRATVASKKARRTGAVYLHLYAAWYGRWLLSKVCHLPSPSGLRDSSFFCLTCNHSQWLVVENFVMDRLPEAVARWVQKVVRDCHASQKRRLQSLLPAYGLQGKCSKQTGFLVRSSSRAQQSDSPDAHFLSSAEKCCVSLLSAHFCVFGFCSRSARWGVSQAQFTVTRKWLPG